MQLPKRKRLGLLCLVSYSSGIDDSPPMVTVTVFLLTMDAGGCDLGLSMMDHPRCIAPRDMTQVRAVTASYGVHL